MSYRSLLARYKARKEHVANFGSFFVNRIISLALFAFTTSVFINRAGNERFGILTMLLLIFSYISIADLGMGYAVGYRLTRAVSRGNKAVAVKILQHAFPFYIAVGLVSSLAVLFFSAELSRVFTKSGEYTFIYRVISLSIFPLLLDSVVLMILQAYNKVYLINASRLFYDLFRAAPLLLVLVVEDNLLEIIICTIAFGCYLKLFLDIYLGYKLFGNLEWLRPAFRRKELFFNLKYGMPMLLTLGIGMIITSIDKFYITNFISLEQLAYYSVALEVNVKAWFLVWSVTGSLQTVLIRRNVANRDTLDLQRISLYAVAIIFGLYYVPLIFFAEQILGVWINKDFAENSYRLVRILAFYSLLYMLYAIRHSILQAAGKFVTITGIYLLGLVTLLTALLVLPKQFGIEGVAYSYVITYAAFVLATIVCMRKVKVNHA